MASPAMLSSRGNSDANKGNLLSAVDSPELRALQALKWASGRALTAHVQDLALRGGKRAMVATSGGSFKKFVCSSETPCSWLVNAVRTRPRRPPPREETDEHETPPGGHSDRESQHASARKYWYVSSACLVHTNCTGMAKPTARQLKDVAALKRAVQHDAAISSAALVDQLKNQARLLCSKSMAYKAKIELLDEMEAQEFQSHQSAQPATTGSVSAATRNADADHITLSTQRLPSYLARLSELNPEIFHAVERHPESNATFYRAIVALDPVRFFSNATPLVFGVDSEQLEPSPANGVSQGGARLVLVGCDGNLETITFATALVPGANEEHYAWFLSKLIDCGYPLQRANGVYCDGRWAVTAACARVGISCTIQDTRRLIEDLTHQVAKQSAVYIQQQGLHAYDDQVLSSTHMASIWTCQRAESEGEFYAELHKLEMSAAEPTISRVESDVSMNVSQYLRALDPRRWAIFPHFTTSRMYGWQTTRFTPGKQDNQSSSVSAPQSLSHPCEFFKSFALGVLKETYHRHERAIQWEREKRVVTPEAERMMQEEMKFVPLYDVAMSAPHVAFVWNPHEAPQLRQRRVDLQAKSCTCAVHLQFGVPCRHILSVLRKLNALAQSFEYFNDNLRVRGYVGAHKGRHIELPLDESLVLDTTWLPAKQLGLKNADERLSNIPISDQAPGSGAADTAVLDRLDEGAGTSTRKRRIRNKPVEERKRAMYKCRKCGVADGHNSLTCPNRPTKKRS